jgi:hypothetical protein
MYSRMFRNALALRKFLAALREDGRLSTDEMRPSSMIRDWRSVRRHAVLLRASGLDRKL